MASFSVDYSYFHLPLPKECRPHSLAHVPIHRLSGKFVCLDQFAQNYLLISFLSS